jgi:uncharacterized protein
MILTAGILGALFLTGILGGVHCAGMCGGIVAALSGQVSSRARQWPLHLAYSAGRLASYAVAGAVAGTAGSLGLLLDSALPVQLVLYVLANLFLVALGLYLAGLWNAVASLERFGSGLWRRLQPLARPLLPANTVRRAFPLGVLWGWLPCGLVYSVLALALLSGGALNGASIMLAFGLGTVPNLVAAGLLYRRFGSFVAARPLRIVSGALVLSFGVYGLVHAAALSEHLQRGLLCLG